MQRVDDHSNVRSTSSQVGSPRQQNSEKVGDIEKKCSETPLEERKQRRRMYTFMSRVMVYVYVYKAFPNAASPKSGCQILENHG